MSLEAKCFVIPPDSKIENNCEEIVCLTPAGLQNLPRFQAQFSFSSSCCFPRELVNHFTTRDTFSSNREANLTREV